MSSTATTSLDGDSASFVSELLDSPTPRSHKARRRRPPHRRLALVVSATSLLISLSTMALVMWYASDLGRTIAWLQRDRATASFQPLALGGLQAGEPAPSQPLTPAGASVAAPSSGTTTERAEMLQANETNAPQRGYECSSRSPGADCGKVAYSSPCNVTNWKKEKDDNWDRDDKFCTNNNFRIDRTGWYYLYSYAWLAGTMDKGVILRAVPNENRTEPRSLVVKHSIVCWQNCGSPGARVLREVKSTALEVLTTHASQLVRLQEGAVIGVSITSPNVNKSGAWTWDRVVFGLVPLS